MENIITKEDYSILIKLVVEEAKKIKLNATQEELNRLDFTSLNPDDATRCIYGLMTGDCENKRGNELILKCCDKVYDTKKTTNNIFTQCELNGPPYVLDKDSEGRGNRIFKYISPIERFIFINSEIYKEDNNRILIRYLKGNSEDINFKNIFDE